MLPMLFCDVLSQMLLRATIYRINTGPKYVLAMKENINIGTFELLCTIHIWRVLSKGCAKKKLFTFSVKPYVDATTEPAQIPGKTCEFSPIPMAGFVSVAKVFAAIYVVFCSKTQKGKQYFPKMNLMMMKLITMITITMMLLMMIVLTLIGTKVVMIQLFRA